MFNIQLNYYYFLNFKIHHKLLFHFYKIFAFYMCFCSGVDILKLVAAQVGSQWINIYQLLANATEREVAAFSKGYSSDHERAYAALQHWTIRDSGANLAKLINALHQQRLINVVEKIRCVMEDNPQVCLCCHSQLEMLVSSSVSMSEGKKDA